jgi:alpha-L-fucosidase
MVEGRAIGHKRIDSFAPVRTSRVRLNILSSSAEAHIREFQLFRTIETMNPKKVGSETGK